MTKISAADALTMLGELFECEPGELQPSTPRAEIQGWDSMGALSLMAELDERFGIELTADMSRSMTGVSSIIGLLRERNALLD